MGDERKELGSLVEQFEKSTGMKYEDAGKEVFRAWVDGYQAGRISGLSLAAGLQEMANRQRS